MKHFDKSSSDSRAENCRGRRLCGDQNPSVLGIRHEIVSGVDILQFFLRRNPTNLKRLISTVPLQVEVPRFWNSSCKRYGAFPILGREATVTAVR